MDTLWLNLDYLRSLFSLIILYIILVDDLTVGVLAVGLPPLTYSCQHRAIARLFVSVDSHPETRLSPGATNSLVVDAPRSIVNVATVELSTC